MSEDKAKQLTGKPGRPRSVEIKGGKVQSDGPTILDGRRGDKGVEILDKRPKEND